MTGHVFHPGHQALHGVTVVLETRGGRTYVGRFDSQDARGVHLHDVGVYEAADTATSQQEFLRRCDRFGIPLQHRDLLVPTDEVVGVQKLVDAVG